MEALREPSYKITAHNVGTVYLRLWSSKALTSIRLQFNYTSIIRISIIVRTLGAIQIFRVLQKFPVLACIKVIWRKSWLNKTAVCLFSQSNRRNARRPPQSLIFEYRVCLSIVLVAVS